jgi:hypothetical protein
VSEGVVVSVKKDGVRIEKRILKYMDKGNLIKVWTGRQKTPLSYMGTNNGIPKTFKKTHSSKSALFNNTYNDGGCCWPEMFVDVVFVDVDSAFVLLVAVDCVIMFMAV